MKIKKLVKLKTLNQLLDTGWEYDSGGDLIYETDGTDETSNYGIFVIRDMFHILGDIIVLEKENKYQLWEYYDKVQDGNWTITQEMVQEELDTEDYPEYFV